MNFPRGLERSSDAGFLVAKFLNDLRIYCQSSMFDTCMRQLEQCDFYELSSSEIGGYKGNREGMV